MVGRVRIGQLRSRFEKGKNAAHPDFKNINVTSSSLNKLVTKSGDITTGKELSPYYLGPIKDNVTGATSKTFENFWQYGKVWPHLGHAHKENGVWKIHPKWYVFRDKGYADTKAHRRPPEAKRIPASFSFNENKIRDYLTSRREIYFPYYCGAIRYTKALQALVEMVRDGQNIMILDCDGPPRADRDTGEVLWPEGMDVSEIFKMMREPKYPFGHGYVVALLVWHLANNDDSYRQWMRKLKTRS